MLCHFLTKLTHKLKRINIKCFFLFQIQQNSFCNFIKKKMEDLIFIWHHRKTVIKPNLKCRRWKWKLLFPVLIGWSCVCAELRFWSGSTATQNPYRGTYLLGVALGGYSVLHFGLKDEERNRHNQFRPSCYQSSQSSQSAACSGSAVQRVFLLTKARDAASDQSLRLWQRRWGRRSLWPISGCRAGGRGRNSLSSSTPGQQNPTGGRHGGSDVYGPSFMLR